MPEDDEIDTLFKMAKNRADEYGDKLAKAKKLIETLDKAGEDTMDLQREFNLAEQRVRKWKRAFGEAV